MGLRQRHRACFGNATARARWVGSSLPILPFPSGLQAAEAVCDVQRAAGQREKSESGRQERSPHKNVSMTL